MIQTNTKPGTRRAIRRVAAGGKPSSSALDKIPDPVKPAAPVPAESSDEEHDGADADEDDSAEEEEDGAEEEADAAEDDAEAAKPARIAPAAAEAEE